MLCAKSNRIIGFAALALFSALFAFGGTSAARAQEPPTTIPAGGPLPFDPNAIPFNSWLLYPSVNFLAENSNNYFITPQSKLSGWAFGVDPSMTAEWSNGIHTTTLYGNFQQLQYPPDNQAPLESNIAAPSGEATWTQQYAPLRDLNFTVVGDYVHQTLSPGLTSSIPNPTQFTGTTVLPNGDIVLPNGTIVSPTGQVVGQAGSTPSVGPTAFVNPYDQYTGSARVQKIFNGGIVTLGTSLQQVDYEHAQPQQSSPDYINKTFTEDASFWLGPVFYAYTDGSFNIRTTGQMGDSTAYRIVGGLGTRQFGLFRTSAYFGYQGSGASTPDTAGGDVYGAVLSYYPTTPWTISANVDESINHAPSNAPPSTQAIGIPGITPLQISLSSSTKITSTSLHSSYIINPQWTVNGLFAYVHVDNIGSPIWQDSWVGDASVSYNIWRDLTLALEYQYSSIVSNAPLTNANRNLITMSATYKF
jgi:Putative beta-barrel porin 2